MKLSHLCQIPALLMLGLLGGCLEFESQTLSYHSDQASDSLRIFQDYRGIFGGDAEGKPEEPLSDKEVAQLESVLEGQRTFFFDNWIFEYNRSDIEQALADLKIPEKSAEPNLPPEGSAKLERLLNLLLGNVRVENGPFYLDAQGKLCGVQMVTLTGVSAIIKSINECAPFMMQEAMDNEKTSPADRAAISKFSKASQNCVELVGNNLKLRWPMSQESYDEAFGAKAKDPARVAEMRVAGLDIAFADDTFTLELGEAADQITSLTLPFSKRQYTPNALAPAREKHVVAESFDPVAAAKRFLLQGAGTK